MGDHLEIIIFSSILLILLNSLISLSELHKSPITMEMIKTVEPQIVIRSQHNIYFHPYPKFVSGNFSIRFLRQYVPLFASIAAFIVPIVDFW